MRVVGAAGIVFEDPLVPGQPASHDVSAEITGQTCTRGSKASVDAKRDLVLSIGMLASPKSVGLTRRNPVLD
jgi:hypothetical protein